MHITRLRRWFSPAITTIALTTASAVLPASAVADSPHPSPFVPPTAAEIVSEIDRVVGEGSSLGAVTADSPPDLQLAVMTRCAEFTSTQRYCLRSGWTSRSEAETRDEVRSAVEQDAASDGEETGDLSLAKQLTQLLRMTVAERAAADQAELKDAAGAIHEVLALQSTSELALASSAADGVPRAHYILKNRVSEQARRNWCGPTSMQMIHWNEGSNVRVRQGIWARRLGTTEDGTSITSMVRTINAYTSWDRAGKYAVVSVSGWTLTEWFGGVVHRTYVARRPVLLHPVLLRQYFPYLDRDGKGHFQVGRGYDLSGGERTDWRISYYEPWNQQRFHSTQRYIPRVQWRKAINSWRANLAHPAQNCDGSDRCRAGGLEPSGRQRRSSSSSALAAPPNDRRAGRPPPPSHPPPTPTPRRRPLH